MKVLNIYMEKTPKMTFLPIHKSHAIIEKKTYSLFSP